MIRPGDAFVVGRNVILWQTPTAGDIRKVHVDCEGRIMLALSVVSIPNQEDNNDDGFWALVCCDGVLGWMHATFLNDITGFRMIGHARPRKKRACL